MLKRMPYNTIWDLKKLQFFFQNGREAGGSNNQVLKNYFIQLKYLIWEFQSGIQMDNGPILNTIQIPD